MRGLSECQTKGFITMKVSFLAISTEIYFIGTNKDKNYDYLKMNTQRFISLLLLIIIIPLWQITFGVNVCLSILAGDQVVHMRKVRKVSARRCNGGGGYIFRLNQKSRAPY